MKPYLLLVMKLLLLKLLQKFIQMLKLLALKLKRATAVLMSGILNLVIVVKLMLLWSQVASSLLVTWILMMT